MRQCPHPAGGLRLFPGGVFAAMQDRLRVPLRAPGLSPAGSVHAGLVENHRRDHCENDDQ